MNRRTAIRNVVLLSAGASILDSCQQGTSMAFRNVPLTAPEEELLAQLADDIIPTTDIVGAKALKSQEFVLLMVDECFTEEDQSRFLEGMKHFDQACEKKFNGSFAGCTADQRAELLRMAESGEQTDALSGNAGHFYRTFKRLTIQSFTSSQEYLTQVRNYSLVPPPFKSCVPARTLQ